MFRKEVYWDILPACAVTFLIFINDLPTALKNSAADIYADDPIISYSDHYNISPQAISNGIQTDMNELQNWSNKNRMTLNERKTKSMPAHYRKTAGFCEVKIQMCVLVHKRLYGECPAYIK